MICHPVALYDMEKRNTYFHLAVSSFWQKTMANTVQSVARTFSLLELLGQSNVGLSISELAERSDLALGTTHRLLQTLIELGYADQDPETHRYTLGLRFLHLHGLVLRRLNLAERAMPLMKMLMRRVNETVHLAVLDGPDIVYIDRVEGLQTVGMYTTIGKRNRAHATALGKAMFAFMPATVWRTVAQEHGLPRYSPNTLTTPEALERDLERTRQRGFAIDNSEGPESVRCVAAPIYDYTGQVIAAASISGPKERMRSDRDEILGEMICDTCYNISTSLGYMGKKY